MEGEYLAVWKAAIWLLEGGVGMARMPYPPNTCLATQ